ncbi:response regulator [Pedobacter jeongneungensis]|uniref:response regulator n=1 Tax=Pedobacter jeongneungensis TaxID=947309 RepID=UPI003CD0737B
MVSNIRKNKLFSKTPVIIISASRDGKEIAIGAGIDDFISKHFDIDELIKRIELQLNSSGDKT